MGIGRCVRMAVVVSGVVAICGPAANAAPAFSNISRQDFDKISKELSANTTLHNVMPASSLGSIFGFEVGLVAGVATTEEIEKLVKETSPSTEVSMIPHAGLIGALTVPFGITGEVAFVPEITAEGAKYSSYAAAVKWALSDELLPVIPFSLSVRGFLAKSDFKFNQTINNASTGNVPTTVNVKYEGSVMGLQLLASPKLPIVEPYLGLGYLSAEGDLSLSGSSTATFFDYTSAQSANTKPTSTQLLVGVNVQLLAIVFGAEYSNAFDTDTFTGKLSFRF